MNTYDNERNKDMNTTSGEQMYRVRCRDFIPQASSCWTEKFYIMEPGSVYEHDIQNYRDRPVYTIESATRTVASLRMQRVGFDDLPACEYWIELA